MEIMPVFTRKPLFAYKVAAAGMLGVALLSFFVWQHHLFQSGINPDMRPLFMLTTELISIPTGFLFLVTLGTLWKAKIRFDTPMLFCLGDAVQLPDRRGHRRVPLRRPRQRDRARELLRDGALPLHDHGWPDLRPVRRVLLLVPEDHREDAEPQARPSGTSGRSSSSSTCTFFPLFLVGILGQPRRVFEYAPNLQTLNDISSISAYFLGASFFFFIINFVWSIYLNPHPAPPNPWDSLGLEWQTPTPVPWFNFERIPVVLNDPYHYGEPDAPPVADLGRYSARPSARPPASVSPEELGTGVEGDGDPRPPIL